VLIGLIICNVLFNFGLMLWVEVIYLKKKYRKRVYKKKVKKILKFNKLYQE